MSRRRGISLVILLLSVFLSASTVGAKEAPLCSTMGSVRLRAPEWLGTSHDNRGGGAASRLERRAPLTGAYFVRVSEAPGSSTCGCCAGHELSAVAALAGDVDADCDVDIVDIMLVAGRWNAVLGDPPYDPRYDLDGDGAIDVVDIMLVATHWGTTCPWINTYDRQVSLNYFNQVYRASEGVAAGWTGDRATCNAGETAVAFREAVRRWINYFRGMAGLPNIVQLSDEYTRKAQQAALMMSVNGQLSHNPPTSWICYTAEGAEAAGHSDLYLGVYGPAAITGYVMDPGSGNYPVGHRRWILYPQTEWMGTGDIPPTGSYRSSNDLWVFDENMWEPRPQTREEYVAWPPPGYVPYQVVFPRWSFAYAGADFSGATVRMSSGGQSIPVTVQAVVNGYGENTLVWEPDLSFGAPPASDTAYDVTVSGVIIDGLSRDFAYQVIVFDPGPLAGAAAGVRERLLGEPPQRPASEE